MGGFVLGRSLGFLGCFWSGSEGASGGFEVLAVFELVLGVPGMREFYLQGVLRLLWFPWAVFGVLGGSLGWFWESWNGGSWFRGIRGFCLWAGFGALNGAGLV